MPVEGVKGGAPDLTVYQGEKGIKVVGSVRGTLYSLTGKGKVFKGAEALKVIQETVEKTSEETLKGTHGKEHEKQITHLSKELRAKKFKEHPEVKALLERIGRVDVIQQKSDPKKLGEATKSEYFAFLKKTYGDKPSQDSIATERKRIAGLKEGLKETFDLYLNTYLGITPKPVAPKPMAKTSYEFSRLKGLYMNSLSTTRADQQTAETIKNMRTEIDKKFIALDAKNDLHEALNTWLKANNLILEDSSKKEAVLRETKTQLQELKKKIGEKKSETETSYKDSLKKDNATVIDYRNTLRRTVGFDITKLKKEMTAINSNTNPRQKEFYTRVLADWLQDNIELLNLGEKAPAKASLPPKPTTPAPKPLSKSATLPRPPSKALPTPQPTRSASMTSKPLPKIPEKK